MKKSIILPLIFGLIAVLLPACSKNHNNIMVSNGVFTVGININYPPMEYYASDGITPIGFDVDLAKDLAKEMGLKIEFADTTWENIFYSLEAKKYDCIISSVTITPDRLNQFNFSGPYIKNSLVLVMPKSPKRNIKSPLDIAGLSVAYQEGTTAADYMAVLKRRDVDYTPFEYGKMTQCFDDLHLGRVDAVMTDLVVAHYYLSDDKYEIVWQGDEEVFGICFKKSDIALLNIVNKSLDRFFADGTIVKISKENFNGMDLVSAVRK